MQRVRIRKQVPIDNLPFPNPIIFYDLLDRVDNLTYNYQSITVSYQSTWIGDTNLLDTYEQTIVEAS